MKKDILIQISSKMMVKVANYLFKMNNIVESKGIMSKNVPTSIDNFEIPIPTESIDDFDHIRQYFYSRGTAIPVIALISDNCINGLPVGIDRVIGGKVYVYDLTPHVDFCTNVEGKFMFK